MGELARRVRWIWRLLRRSRELEADMQDEMRFHIEMEAAALRRKGVNPQEARRQAFVRFGGVEKFKEEGRHARGLLWVDNLALDARLGARMLLKHRWLTLVGGIAMAVAIGIGATAFEAIGVLVNPSLPFAGGDRLVAIKYTTSGARGEDRRMLHMFGAWRGRLRTVEHLGAFRTVRHNMVVPGGAPEPIAVAEITGAGFTIPGTAPLLGRYLVPADEQERAAPVLVIGHDAWRSRFGADPGVVGRSIVLAGVPTTIVGVMPAGFGFPVNHQFWRPLRLDPVKYQPWSGPEISLFGRLAVGATIEQARAEVEAAGQSMASTHPDTPQRVQAVVLPYTSDAIDSDPTFRWMLSVARILVGALSFVVAVNLAILLYARTVTRLGEIAVRTALGASRGRILTQLFVEALALTLLGAAVGLALSRAALLRVHTLVKGSFPYWVTYELSLTTIVYALALAVVAALIMGVLPGLKATGQRLSVNLQELHGRTGTRLGGVWTSLIVAQVAVAVAILPAAAYLAWHVARIELKGPSIPLERLLIVDLDVGDDGAADAAEARRRQQAMIARLRNEPGVGAVTFSSGVPGLVPDRRIEFERPASPRAAGTHEVAVVDVDVDLMDVYGARLLAGRSFDVRDADAPGPVIVNRTFVTEFLDASSGALGHRFRYVAAAGGQPAASRAEWYEIAGVVDDFPGFPRDPGSEGEPTVYMPVSDVPNAVLTVRFNEAIPGDAAERLRRIGAEIDPTLQLQRVVPLSSFYDDLRSVWRSLAWAVAFVTMTVLLLSAAGVHSLMSFTIAQRWREIGIRSALGAPPRQLLLGVFGRAARQVSVGLVVGSLLAVAVFTALGVGFGVATALLVAVAAVMALVASLAALGPARRSLRIQAVEALRAE